jgi:hypothetical protein
MVGGFIPESRAASLRNPQLHGQVLEETSVEVDSFRVGRDIEGMTARNFDPHKHVSISAEALSDSGH